MLKTSLKAKDYEKYAEYFLEELEKKAPYAYIEATRSLLNYGKKRASCSEVNSIYLSAAKNDQELENIYRLLVGLEGQSPVYSTKPFNFEKVIENIFVMIHTKSPELLAQLEKLDISNRMSKSFSSPQEIVNSVLEEIKKISGADHREWETNLREATGLEERMSLPSNEAELPLKADTKERQTPPAVLFDERLFFGLQGRLTLGEMSAFAKIVLLFLKSIISYNEMYYLGERYFLQAGKDWCMEFKKEVELREQSRSNLNCFNIKNVTRDVDGTTNKSYKRIEKSINFNPAKDSAINKEYMCLAQGTESQGNGDEVKKIIKIQPEINLLFIEDQMYEVDLTLAQLKFICSLLKRYESALPSPAHLNTMIAKITNIGIIQTLLGTKGLELLNKISTEPFILQFMISLVSQKIVQIQAVVKEKLQTEWLSSINENYYKALDLRSSYIKLIDKKFISPRHILHELKTKAHSGTEILLLSNLNSIFGARERSITLEGEKRHTAYHKPIFAFDLGDRKVCADVLLFLKFFVRFKIQNSDKERVLAVVEKLLESYLCILEAPDKEELLSNENLAETAARVERQLYGHKHFFVGDNISLEQNTAKISELEIKIREITVKAQGPVVVEEMDQKKIERIFNDIIDVKTEEVTGETVIASVASKKSPKSFFASSPCYLALRYFTILYERFAYVRKFSAETLGSDALYVSFKKILLYQLNDIIDAQKYEDLLRMLLDLKAGAFFSLDKIFHAFCKNQLDDLCNYAINLCSVAFDGIRATSEPEETLFSKICYKHFELQGATHKAGKNAASSAHKNAPSDSGELIKFEYCIDTSILIIHRIKSAFSSTINTLGKFFDKSHQALLVTNKKEPAAAMPSPSDVVWRYNISKHFKIKQQKTVSLFANSEDFISRKCHNSNCAPEVISEARKLKAKLLDEVLEDRMAYVYRLSRTT